MRAYVACGKVTVQQTDSHLQLRVDGFLVPAPEMVIQVAETTSAASNMSWDSIISDREKSLRIGKERRLVPWTEVALPMRCATTSSIDRTKSWLLSI